MDFHSLGGSLRTPYLSPLAPDHGACMCQSKAMAWLLQPPVCCMVLNLILALACIIVMHSLVLVLAVCVFYVAQELGRHLDCIL